MTNINYEVTKKSIGKAIQYWRLVEGFHQKDVSEKLVTERSYIAKLEGGHVGISIKQIIVMANILGVSYLTLIRGLPPEKALGIIDDMYQDIELNITKQEHEALWCQNVSDISYKKYHAILSVLRNTEH